MQDGILDSSPCQSRQMSSARLCQYMKIANMYLRMTEQENAVCKRSRESADQPRSWSRNIRNGYIDRQRSPYRDKPASSIDYYAG